VNDAPPGGGAAAPPRRPVSVVLTLACAFAGLADLQAVSFAFSPQIRQALAAHPWVPAVVAALALLQIGCLIATWRGRRAGLVGFLALALTHNVVMLVARSWSPCFLVPPAVVAVAGLWAWDRLR
jgi:hypothetical protein